MADNNFRVDSSNQPIDNQPQQQNKEFNITDANYRINTQKERGPAAIGRGGDALYRHINNATKENLNELNEQTGKVQDFIQRETSNNVAINWLEKNNYKDTFKEFNKTGFQNYGPLKLMGYKHPQGFEIIRLTITDKEDNIIENLSGIYAEEKLIQILNEYQNSRSNSENSSYEVLENFEQGTELSEITDIEETIQDYNGNTENLTT